MGAATIAFTLPARSDIDLALYDVRGRRVATLAQGVFEAGPQSVRWEGLDSEAVRGGGHSLRAADGPVRRRGGDGSRGWWCCGSAASARVGSGGAPFVKAEGRGVSRE
jgi:hypothetical protein